MQVSFRHSLFTNNAISFGIIQNPSVKLAKQNTPSDIFERTEKVVSDYRKILFKKAKRISIKNSLGETIPALLVKPKSGSWYIESNNKVAGYVNFSFTDAHIKGENYPNYYKHKPYLFINSIYSTEGYKGVGTLLIKELVKESDKLGFGGRICLNASTTKVKRGSPVPFYYKFGFQSTNKNKHYSILEALDRGEKIPKDCEATTMFLPQNRINQILNKN